MNLLSFLLMSPPAGQEGSAGFMSFLPLVVIIVIFYFFFIRPQVKKSKDERKYREGLQKGDKVVTIGGIHGKILEVQESTVIIEVEGANRLKVEKSAVSIGGASQDQLQKK
ncbi:MAG: preprotein translocase subunit YajC [Bacteroidales bacterium]|jgi:preprotein translocase subunit YajC|nr:preprotein translocase subunit YajC [Bacteroidales bacterium]